MYDIHIFKETGESDNLFIMYSNKKSDTDGEIYYYNYEENYHWIHDFKYLKNNGLSFSKPFPRRPLQLFPG